MDTAVNIVLIVAGLYLLAGAVFAIFFLTAGIIKVDETAHGSGLGFRLIILPGTIVLWPLLMKKWIKAKR